MSEQKEQIAQERFGKSFDELESEKIVRVDLQVNATCITQLWINQGTAVVLSGCPSLSILRMHASCHRVSGKCIFPPLAAIIK